MWGMISAAVDLACLAAVATIWIRMLAMHRRHGLRFFAIEALLVVPRGERRPLLRAIRRGEPVPPEYLGAARQWARSMLLRQGYPWTSILMIPVLVGGLPAVYDTPGPQWRAAFWLAPVLVGVLIVGAVQAWRDQRAAARLFRDTAPTA